MSLKNPNWADLDDRELYKKLYYSNTGRELTKEEKEFCKTMSVMEQYACGLDGR